MRKLLYKASLILTLLTALLAAICWLYADQLLNSLARPYLEKLTAQQLGADVQLRQLILTDDGVELHTLLVEKAGQFTIELPRVSLDFNLSSLWRRQLTALKIDEPQIDIVIAQPRNQKSTSIINTQGLSLKHIEKIPITIDSIEISNGRLMLHHGDQEWQLQRLNYSGELQPKSDFQLSALFGPEANHPLAIQGSAEISPRQTLSLQSLSWQNQQLLTAPLTLALSETAVSVSDSQLRLERFDRKQLQELLNTLGQTELLPPSLDFTLSGISVSFAHEEQTLSLNVEITEALIGWAQFKSKVSDIDLKLTHTSDSWRLEGQLQGPENSTLILAGQADNKFQISGNLHLDLPKPGQLKSALLGGKPLPLAGGFKLTSDYRWQIDRLQASVQLQGYATTAQPHAPLLLEHLKGTGQLKLSHDTQDFSLHLDLADKPFLTATGTPSEIDIALRLTGLQQARKLFSPEILPKQLKNIINLKSRALLTSINSDFVVNLVTSAEQLSVANLTLNNLTGKHNLNYTSGRVELVETDFNAEFSLGKELTAKLDLKGSGFYKSDKFSLSIHQLNLHKLNYLSADEKKGIGDASFSVRGTISGISPWSALSLELSGALAASEILISDFYADLSPYKGKFTVTGQLNPKLQQLTAEALTFQLPSVGNITASGGLNRQLINLQFDAKLPNLASSYGEHIGPLLYGSYPALEELTLKGQLALAATLSWAPNGWRSSGNLQVQGLDADWQRLQLEIVEGNGEVPFSIAMGRTENKLPSEMQKSGYISFGSLGFGLATLEKGNIQLTATPNRFSINSPLILHLADGAVRIENLNMGLADGQPDGAVDINVSAVDLQSLTQELDLPVMQGSLSANLGRLRYQDRQLSTDGIANIEVFGGLFQIRNMRYSDPFSSYPVFHGDIDFTGLDLLQATRTFDFGEMNGVLDGHIHGLQLFGNIPSAFKAAVTTRPKGKRNISVKALNNLSILSQGGISSALSRGIYRFIDYYRYRQLGFECALENDTFTLTGTALPGSERYLVYGGLLPPRIDITTTTPTISFKEMVNRLGRIQRTGN